jgi:tetratricopeptide (TPR) repeat protein
MKRKHKYWVLTTTGALVVGLLLFQFLVVIPTARQARLIGEHDTFQKNLDALKRDPNDAMAHRELGYRYSAREDWRRAELHWREAARLEPGNRESRFFLAVALQKQNKIDAATELYRRIITENMADDYERIARKKLQKLAQRTMPPKKGGGRAFQTAS